MKIRRPTNLVIFLLALLPARGLAEDTVKAVPIHLEAADVLPKELLKGPNYHIKPSVKNDGFSNVYEVTTTEHGAFKAESTAELKLRIGELRALAAMEEISQAKEFGSGAWEAAKAPVKGAANMVTSPIDTTKSIFTGTGRFLGNIGRSIVSSDPHQDNVLKTALGYDGAKRAYAYEFGVDPYSSFKPMTDRVGQLARATVAGGITVSMGMSSATSGTFGTVLFISKTSEQMRQVVRDNPPGVVAKMNREKLEKMGIKKPLIDAFLGNYTYNPSEATMLVGELASMGSVLGRDVFISAAAAATDEDTARYWRLKAQMMAGYHAHIGGTERLANVAGWPTIITKDGVGVAVDPVDYVFLTRDTKLLTERNKQTREKMGIKASEYWISGKFDSSMRQFLEAAGWKLVEGANSKLVK